jgi:NDP-sugar pyrophosphorylase family protein
LMEKTIRHMRRTGIKTVNVTTHYLGEAIESHFGDGARFGLKISYTDEKEPRGTAGALTLMERPSSATLVVNGDVLTDLDFSKMHGFHREHGAVMTMAVREYSLVVPYGVVETEGMMVKRVLEKPRHEYFINAGIYILEPEAFDAIPRDQRYDMTDLVDRLIEEGIPIAIFPIHEYWLDIGHFEDYRRAERDWKEGRIQL